MTATRLPYSPHDTCIFLEKEGDAYWLEPLRIGPHGPCRPDPVRVLDVLQHGPEWVEVTETRAGLTDGVTYWTRWVDLGPFEIMVS